MIAMARVVACRRWRESVYEVTSEALVKKLTTPGILT